MTTSTGLPTPTEGASALDTMRTDIQHTIEAFIELGIIVHDYPDEPTTKRALDMQINKLVEDMGRVQRDSSALRDVNIPIDILDYIDAGRNPDIYSREFVEHVVQQNQFINGKIKGMCQFRDILASELSDAFPDLKDQLATVVDYSKNPKEKDAGQAANSD